MPPMKPGKTKAEDYNTSPYWRSLDERKISPHSPETLPQLETEAGKNAESSISRRQFLSLMGASMALAGAVGCRRPLEHIVPYVKQPEEIIPGLPIYYATAMPIGEDAHGILVESHEGRPTKIEGNKEHPASLGKAGALHQAAILSLYDPDRSRHPSENQNKKRWEDFSDYWRDLYPEFIKNQGESVAVLCESSCSPALTSLKKSFLNKFKKATWVTYEPIDNENMYNGLASITGKKYRSIPLFDQAKVIVSLESDFLLTESNSVYSSSSFAKSRKISSKKDSMNRLYVAENMMTSTGGMADHRLRILSSKISHVTLALAQELEHLGVKFSNLSSTNKISLTQQEQSWVKAAAEDLNKNRGKGIMVAGRRQPKQVHALVYALNQALGNVGKSIKLVEPTDVEFSDRDSFSALVKQMDAGAVNNLLILGGNPVYNAPADTNFLSALKKVPSSIHLSPYFNETSKEVQWHLPQAHFLESWGDTRSWEGSPCVIQPLISPLFHGKSTLELLYLITHGSEKSGYEIVREKWQGFLGQVEFEKHWRRTLHDGILKNKKYPEASPNIDPKLLKKAVDEIVKFSSAQGSDFELVFVSSPAVFDGRFANNGWLQELPDPITKLVWDNAALMSRKSAEKLGINLKEYEKLGEKKYAMVSLKYQGRELELPAFIVPGQADHSIAISLGYGRTACGKVGDGVGFNAYTLRSSDKPDFDSGLKVSKTGKTYTLSTTQNHHHMEGRPIVREADLQNFKKDGKLHPHLVHAPHMNSLWKEHPYEKSPQWGMTIDLNVCTGCNACVIACQSENNIPIVGKKEAGYGRAMHWIRLDRYFSGSKDDPKMVQQPVPCMHCENAPCEQVCPVQATNHDQEGLNVMVYNRCIGTRYCSNNCPYKVRRFNFYNYTNHGPETWIRGKANEDLQNMSQNPDVTVRFRGVMEKCTYCTQRINEAKIKAKLDGVALQDGDVTPACEQTCPVGAIVFGDITDKNSRVSKSKKQDRDYVVLGELNTKPRTSYLGKIRNPKPQLQASSHHKETSHH